MSILTNPAARALRDLLRRVGLTRTLARLILGSGYEARFGSAMLQAVRPGDCVWDVGANVGLYTIPFSSAVGPSGSVYAFEPSPQNFSRLVSTVDGHANVVALEIGLAERATTAFLRQGSDPTGATSSLVEGQLEDDHTFQVTLETGDALINSKRVRGPDIVKLDVEGYELEVIQGLRNCLRSRPPRDIFIEVHFSILKARGLSDAPRILERILEESGYSKRWLDPSHLHARVNDALH